MEIQKSRVATTVDTEWLPQRSRGAAERNTPRDHCGGLSSAMNHQAKPHTDSGEQHPTSDMLDIIGPC